MPDRRELTVCVHLGAHKTATTYIQRSLDGARASLAAAGTAIILPADIRGRIGLKNPSIRFTPEENAGRIADAQPKLDALLEQAARAVPATRIVLSEETLIGSSRHNLSRQSLYDDIALRLRVLPDWLNSGRVTFFFSTRAYPEFFASNVTTAIRGRYVCDLDRLRAGLIRSDRRWFDVIADIREAFPKARLRLWRYEDLSAVQGRLMQDMAGQGIEMYSGPRLTTTLSAGAMDWLLARAGTPDFTDPSRKIIRQARARFPVGEDNPPFSLWDKDRAEFHALQDTYRQDWDAIRARWPDAVVEPD